mmetsp:Transcript_112676/g.313416  ORF Transcript_112676/g.313416 Transcript_112676/m.313416 type:complete len:159 (-) Transcript_112676:132-608(-)|eukprot:CAMPEP_0179120412 /NCGR_PEP_ID=MMETSP0796-20121207/56731_1 /TAXON_ID=73915 /ORGANISM="Pyrodinium bahamense, Strain pbaha01" /LENGTH=158 /DNA_ID=CAMNT_0020818951 /DNA_START=125 /DNA_END=601 /DNA_ORIENTATION=-
MKDLVRDGRQQLGSNEFDTEQGSAWMRKEQLAALAVRFQEMAEEPVSVLARCNSDMEHEDDATPVRRRGQTASLEIQQLFGHARWPSEDEGPQLSSIEATAAALPLGPAPPLAAPAPVVAAPRGSAEADSGGVAQARKVSPPGTAPAASAAEERGGHC